MRFLLSYRKFLSITRVVNRATDDMSCDRVVILHRIAEISRIAYYHRHVFCVLKEAEPGMRASGLAYSSRLLDMIAKEQQTEDR